MVYCQDAGEDLGGILKWFFSNILIQNYTSSIKNNAVLQNILATLEPKSDDFQKVGIKLIKVIVFRPLRHAKNILSPCIDFIVAHYNMKK